MALSHDFFVRCFRHRSSEELSLSLEQRIYNEPALAAIKQILEQRSFMMGADLYEHYKKMFNDTKPIRGRAEDVRPIGQRRRDWELIEMDGDVVACKLYNTQVVRYYPNGQVGLRCGGWPTPLTADFIHTHSPWRCIKRYRKLWVSVPDASGEHRSYPIPNNGELVFERVGSHWQPTSEVKIMKSVVDREKSKQAREPVKPFMKWAKSFLAMSDGWVMHETRKQVQGINPNGWGYERRYMTDSELYELVCSDDSEKHMLALCGLLEISAAEERRLVEETKIQDTAYTAQWTDTRFQFEQLRNRVERVIKNSADIYTTVEVEVGAKMQAGIV
jgi:hypothetical protein